MNKTILAFLVIVALALTACNTGQASRLAEPSTEQLSLEEEIPVVTKPKPDTTTPSEPTEPYPENYITDIRMYGYLSNEIFMNENREQTSLYVGGHASAEYEDTLYQRLYCRYWEGNHVIAWDEFTDSTADTTQSTTSTGGFSNNMRISLSSRKTYPEGNPLTCEYGVIKWNHFAEEIGLTLNPDGVEFIDVPSLRLLKDMETGMLYLSFEASHAENIIVEYDASADLVYLDGSYEFSHNGETFASTNTVSDIIPLNLTGDNLDRVELDLQVWTINRVETRAFSFFNADEQSVVKVLYEGSPKQFYEIGLEDNADDLFEQKILQIRQEASEELQ